MASYFLSKTAQQVDQILSDYYSKNTGNRFVLTTGNQTITGTKTFNGEFNVSSNIVNISKPSNSVIVGQGAATCQIGVNSSSLMIGQNAVSTSLGGINLSIGDASATNIIGNSASSNDIGSSSATNYVGLNTATNYICDFYDPYAALYNSFSSNITTDTLTNLFGANNIGFDISSTGFDFLGFGNVFGSDSNRNQFGCVTYNTYLDTHYNYFGMTAEQLGNPNTIINFFGGCNEGTPVYGLGETINYYGKYSKQNHFGPSSDNNYYYSGAFVEPVRLQLLSFTGSKTQAGNLGELKVSGTYLYICTGTNTWGRTLISTF